MAENQVSKLNPQRLTRIFYLNTFENSNRSKYITRNNFQNNSRRLSPQRITNTFMSKYIMSEPLIDHLRLSNIVDEEDKRIEADRKRALTEKRVECRLVRNYIKQAKARHFTINCDEPYANGGEDSAPQATEYFLAGAGFCELSLYARYAALLGIRVDSIEMSVIGHLNKHVFWTRRPVGRIGQVIFGFSDITFETRIKSSESPKMIKELVAEVEGRCPIYATIKNPTPIQNVVYLNDKPISSAKGDDKMP